MTLLMCFICYEYLRLNIHSLTDITRYNLLNFVYLHRNRWPYDSLTNTRAIECPFLKFSFYELRFVCFDNNNNNNSIVNILVTMYESIICFVCCYHTHTSGQTATEWWETTSSDCGIESCSRVGRFWNKAYWRIQGDYMYINTRTHIHTQNTDTHTHTYTHTHTHTQFCSFSFWVFGQNNNNNNNILFINIILIVFTLGTWIFFFLSSDSKLSSNGYVVNYTYM